MGGDAGSSAMGFDATWLVGTAVQASYAHGRGGLWVGSRVVHRVGRSDVLQVVRHAVSESSFAFRLRSIAVEVQASYACTCSTAARCLDAAQMAVRAAPGVATGVCCVGVGKLCVGRGVDPLFGDRLAQAWRSICRGVGSRRSVTAGRRSPRGAVGAASGQGRGRALFLHA